MAKFIIEGGKSLKGEVMVSGAKNAATSILTATLLTDEECEIDNVPKIEDVFRILEILSSLGTKIEWVGEHKLKISSKEVDPKGLNQDAVCQLRSSILLLGALAHRVKIFSLPPPGGCQIGSRPMGAHFKSLKSLGVKAEGGDKYLRISYDSIKGGQVVMSEFSVTATENTIMAAVLSKGETIIKCAASEHYVQDLCWFLNKMGAKISGIGSHTLRIKGVKKLRGCQYTIMPDPIETGTFLALGAATRSNILIKRITPEFIESELLKFKEANVNFRVKSRDDFSENKYRLADIEVNPSIGLKAIEKIHNMPYPGFAADLLPPFAVLMTQAKGTSLIHDWMYEGRLKYIEELRKMGADATILDPHRALITGLTPLYGKEITSFDLRAGATLIIAALVAQGQTIINNIYQVDRGYEKLEERLVKIGAKIERVKD